MKWRDDVVWLSRLAQGMSGALDRRTRRSVVQQCRAAESAAGRCGPALMMSFAIALGAGGLPMASQAGWFCAYSTCSDPGTGPGTGGSRGPDGSAPPPAPPRHIDPPDEMVCMGPPGSRWDVQFEERLTYRRSTFYSRSGSVYSGPSETVYPWNVKTQRDISCWYHVAMGSTTYVYGAGPSGLTTVLGLNFIRYPRDGERVANDGWPVGDWNAPRYWCCNSTGQGFRGLTYVPSTFQAVGTNFFRSEIRNLQIRPHGRPFDPFRPVLWPTPPMVVF